MAKLIEKMPNLLRNNGCDDSLHMGLFKFLAGRITPLLTFQVKFCKGE